MRAYTIASDRLLLGCTKTKEGIGTEMSAAEIVIMQQVVMMVVWGQMQNVMV